MSGSDYTDTAWDKNFKIPRRNNRNINEDFNSRNSAANNSYYDYYNNQYSQSNWQQTTAYPQQYYSNQASGKYFGNHQGGSSNMNPVEAVTQNIYNTLSNIKERPKNYQKNIFKETVPDVGDTSLPKELTLQFQPLFCKLCSAQLSSSVMAKLHYKSKNHEKKIRKYLREYSEKTNTPLHPRAKVVATQKVETENDPKWFHCDICDLPLTGKMHAESHYMGKNHQKVVMGHKQPAGRGFYSEDGKWQRQGPTKRTILKDGEDTFGLDFKKQKLEEPSEVVIEPSQPVASKFHCEICNVGTTCQEQLDIHYQGQKHKKKLKLLGIFDASSQKPPAKMSIEPTKFYCNICNVSNTCQDQLDIHFQGQKHKKKLKLYGIADTQGDQAEAAETRAVEVDLNLSVYRTPSGDYYCPLCNLTLASGIQFKLHLKGKQHIKKNAVSKKDV